MHQRLFAACSSPAIVTWLPAPAQTNGRGVDMALNSLADEKLLATVRCIAYRGHLLEIGKYNIIKGTPLSMAPMHQNVSFQGIDLDTIILCLDKDEVQAACIYSLCVAVVPFSRVCPVAPCMVVLLAALDQVCDDVSDSGIVHCMGPALCHPTV